MENNKNGNSTIPLSINLTFDSRYYLGTTRKKRTLGISCSIALLHNVL